MTVGPPAERPASPPARVRRVPRTPRDRDGLVDLDACAAALAPADVLESAPGTGWSYVVPHGGPVLRADGARSVLTDDRQRLRLGRDPFTALDQVAAAAGLDPHHRQPVVGEAPDLDELPPFLGGLVGALGYELGRHIERLPGRARSDRWQADLVMRVAEVVLAITPDRQRAWVVTRPVPTPLTPRLAPPGLQQRADALIERLAVRGGGVRPAPPGPVPAQAVVTSLPGPAYLAAVGQILERIGAGDVFQVNLTQRLTARWPGDVVGLYQALRAVSAAAHGAVLPGIGVASISPETFLDVEAGRVRTRPIKGTRPRSEDATLDAALADDLATSAKDRAENVMVVDLERNDLGRVCLPGSVRVPHLTELEGHPTVWHLVSTVVGELRPDAGYADLLRATFPCGSITGAPKVSAMTLIDRLEGVRRGWYCGALGFLGTGRAALSVAIRTATLHPDGRADYGAGGGIVADSDPAAELAESLDKAVPFLRAVGATRVLGPEHRSPEVVT